MATTPKELDLTIYQGRTFKHVLRWEVDPMVYKAITAITKAAPVSMTATGHGLRTGWYAAITDVLGMTQINATANHPRDKDYHQVTRVDDNTITINDIDAASFSTYTSGGYLRYRTPASLASYTARMDIKNKVGGTVLLAIDSTSEITLDDTEHTITIELTPTVTAAITTWTRGVYDLELVSATGTVDCLLTGTVTVIPEVTTSA